MGAENFQGFRQVGEFAQPRSMIRTVRNPLDKATIVSIYPKTIDEKKETLFPGRWVIPAGRYDAPSVTVIGTSSWWRDIDLEQPLLEIPVSAVQIAQSIIVDYCNGFLACNMADLMPGFFFIPGELTLAQVKKDYSMKLAEAKFKQDAWFAMLIKIANSLWARSNGNPLVIWDEMRMAARELGKEDVPWLKMDVQMNLVKCFACGSLRDPLFPICPACKNIDMDHPRAKDIKLAAS
jgi:hypothetical protein